MILLRDEARLALKFRTENRFLRGEVESLKRELALSNAEKAGKDSIITLERIRFAKLTDNNVILSQQLRRAKKREWIVIGPGYGVGIGGGMIHHMAGIHATLNIFDFLRL